MDDLDVIKLYRTEAGWMARFEGPHSVVMRAGFNTDTLPTAFTAQVEAGTVLQAIAQLNPDALVVLER